MEEAVERMEQEEQGAEDRMGKELKLLLQKDVRLQSQFDRAVSMALNKAKANRERNGGENGEQPGEGGERERRLSLRERELALRERRADAAMVLGERGLPAELADCLNLESDEQARQSMERLSATFTRQVSKAVEERLKGSPPKEGGEAVYAGRMRAALGLK